MIHRLFAEYSFSLSILLVGILALFGSVLIHIFLVNKGFYFVFRIIKQTPKYFLIIDGFYDLFQTVKRRLKWHRRDWWLFQTFQNYLIFLLLPRVMSVKLYIYLLHQHWDCRCFRTVSILLEYILRLAILLNHSFTSVAYLFLLKKNKFFKVAGHCWISLLQLFQRYTLHCFPKCRDETNDLFIICYLKLN